MTEAIEIGSTYVDNRGFRWMAKSISAYPSTDCDWAVCVCISDEHKSAALFSVRDGSGFLPTGSRLVGKAAAAILT